MLRKITANRMLCAFDRIGIEPLSAYTAKTLAIAKPFVVPRDEELDRPFALAEHLVDQLLVKFQLTHHAAMRHVAAMSERIDVAALVVFECLAQILYREPAVRTDAVVVHLQMRVAQDAEYEIRFLRRLPALRRGKDGQPVQRQKTQRGHPASQHLSPVKLHAASLMHAHK